jgi:hypothetical protein
VIEFVGVKYLDAKRKTYYKTIQKILDMYPFLAFTVVVHTSDRSKAATAIDSLREIADLRRVRFIIDSVGIGSHFGILESCYAVYVTDSENRLRLWRGNGLKKEELYQVAEKFGGPPVQEMNAGKDALKSLLAEGNQLPPLEIISLTTGDTLSSQILMNIRRTCFLFVVECTSCEIKSFLSRLSAVEDHPSLHESGKPVFLYAGDMELSEFSEYLSTYDISMPAFAIQNLGEILDASGTGEYFAEYPIVFSLNTLGFIESYRAFEEYVNELYSPKGKI